MILIQFITITVTSLFAAFTYDAGGEWEIFLATALLIVSIPTER